MRASRAFAIRNISDTNMRACIAVYRSRVRNPIVSLDIGVARVAATAAAVACVVRNRRFVVISN